MQPSVDTPMTTTQYIRKIFRGFCSLTKGMRLTMGYLLDPRKTVTQQYPENRETLTLFPRFRAKLIMHRNEDGDHLCTACGLCEKACPNGTISILATKDDNGKKILGKYVYRLMQCTLCNLCVEACPFGAIGMGQDFELAVYDRAELIITLYDRMGEPDGVS